MSLKRDFLKLEVVAAMAGSKPELNLNGSASSAVDYIGQVLNSVFMRYGTVCRVDAPPYPPSSKIPLIVTTDDGNQRMLWFYPCQSEEWLTEELTDLVFGMLEEYVRIPA